MKLCNLLCGLYSISQGRDLHFQYAPLCHMYTCIRDGVWKDWAGGTWWTSNAFSRLHPAALTKVPHCLLTLQAALWPPEEGKTATTFCDFLVLLAWWGLFSLPASVTLVLLLTSPLRLCLHLPCPRHSSRRVFYKPSSHKSAQSIVPSTHQDWKIVFFSALAEPHPKLYSTTAVDI